MNLDFNQNNKCALKLHYCNIIAKRISCGHYVCRKCVPPSWSTNNYRFECKICKEINKHDLRRVFDTNRLNEAFFENSNQIAISTNNEFNQLLKRLSEKFKNNEDRIEKTIEYSFDEMEIRIESLKIQLDNHFESLLLELDSFEKTLLSICEIHNQEFTDLQNEIKLNSQADKISIIEAENFMKIFIKKRWKEFDLKFCPERIKLLNLKSIGVFLSNDLKHKFQMLENFKEMKIIDEPWDMAKIYDDYFLTANYFQASISIYDRNCRLVRIIDSIDDVSFQSLSITTNEINRIYISDFTGNRILMCDYEFDLISAIGEFGNNNCQFFGPSGIFYYENSIFICDYHNKRMQKFSSILAFENSYVLNSISPSYIKISNSIALVKTDDEEILHIYALPNFIIRSKFDQQIGSIGIFDNQLFHFDFLNMKVYCFDNNGYINDSFIIHDYDEHKRIEFDDWTCSLEIDDQLIISPGSSFKFLVN